MTIRELLGLDVRLQHGIPVAPGALPLLGHTARFALDRYAFLSAMKERLGPLFWLDILGHRWLSWLDEEALALLANQSTSSLGYREVVGDTFGESLIIQDGVRHQRARKVLNPAFTPRGLAAADVGSLIKTVVEARIAGWREGQPLSALAETQSIALHVIFRIMGIPTENVHAWERLYRQALLALSPIRSTLPGTPRWRGERAIQQLDAELLAMVRRSRSEGGDGTLAQMARGRDDGGREMAETELVHNLRLLLIAGHETSASSMAWMLLHLAHEPRLWSALVRSVEGSAEIATSIEELRPFSYAQGLFREALRLHPPVDMIPRLALEEIEIRGHRIPAGTSMFVSTLLLSRSAERYPDPMRIEPARWQERPRPTPIETCQFGAGPHFCLGYNLAMAEGSLMALVMARELSRRGLRPRLATRIHGRQLPRPRYLPLIHPPASARLVLERA